MSGLPAAPEDYSWPPESKHGPQGRLRRRQPGRPPHRSGRPYEPCKPVRSHQARCVRWSGSARGSHERLHAKRWSVRRDGGVSWGLKQSRLGTAGQEVSHWDRLAKPIVSSALHRAHCRPRRLVSTLGDVAEKATPKRVHGILEGQFLEARCRVVGSGDLQDTRHRPAQVQSTHHLPVAIKPISSAPLCRPHTQRRTSPGKRESITTAPPRLEVPVIASVCLHFTQQDMT